MLVAVNEKGDYIRADEAEINMKFRCPVCFSPVILKRGQYKIAHFSHHRVTDCYKTAYKQESLEHLAGKHYLYDLFSKHQVMMEYYLNEIEQIPDIYIDHQLALELQLSVIPLELIVSRTLGYRMINKEVIWIADDRMIKQGESLKLTAFLRSLIDTKRMRLITYHPEHQQCYLYGITGVNQQLELVYKKLLFNEQSLETSFILHSSIDHIESSLKRKYIRQCQQERSVLQPTLSHLYQLRIDWRNLPKTLGIIVPMQFYIRTHPIEWQSRLILEISQKTFHLESFCRYLKYHVYHLNHLSKIDITHRLISQYYEAVKELYVQN